MLLAPPVSPTDCIIAALCAEHPAVANLRKSLLRACAIQLRDVIDNVTIPRPAEGMSAALGAAPGVWREVKPFPPAVRDGAKLALTIAAHSIERVLRACSSDAFVFGPPNGPLRRARIAGDHQRACDVVERRGAGYEPEALGERKLRRALIHQQLLRTRERQFRTVDAGLRHAERLIDAAVADLGDAWAASLFLRAEIEHRSCRCRRRRSSNSSNADTRPRDRDSARTAPRR